MLVNLRFLQRTVDRLYVDRTFAGQDWFGLRQQVLKVIPLLHVVIG